MESNSVYNQVNVKGDDNLTESLTLFKPVRGGKGGVLKVPGLIAVFSYVFHHHVNLDLKHEVLS